MSILNALATGKGGALSIGLTTTARVTLSDGPGRIRFSNGQTGKVESGALAERVVQRTLEHYHYQGKLHGRVETSSNIPSSVGLKSSSAAANAVALATVSALGGELPDDELVEIGLEASIDSGATLTGAFDDSYASYYGGAVLTDNRSRSVEMIPEIGNGLRILLLVPGERNGNVPLDPSNYSSIKRISQLAYNQAIDGKIWDALTLNGLAFSSILGQDPSPALAAISAGALGAGLSGKGPAIVAVATADTAESVRRSLVRFGGQIIETQPNFHKASIEA